MMRSMGSTFVAVAVLSGAAQQATSSAGDGAPARPDAPMRLIAVQQLAMAAYPELRGSARQMRVDARGGDGETVTFGLVERDGDTLLAQSRPRTAVLVIDAVFDEEPKLMRATLRGSLARSQDRRELRGRTSGWGEALEAARAAFPPSKQLDFVRQLDRDLLRGLVGRLTPATATFQTGTADDGLYWEVAATSAIGEPLALRFEPFGGRLIGFARGGRQ